jgi:integrase
MKLTDRLARSLSGPPEGKDEIIYPDDVVKRLGLRVRRSGARRWIVDYELADGRARRVTLGDPAVVSCAAARHKARALRARASLGEDPQGDRVAARRAVTFGARIEAYLAEIASKVRPVTLSLRRRHLMRHAKPLHRTAPGAITRGDVVALLARIAGERGEVAANRCGASLTNYFAWLVLSGAASANPMIGIKPYPEASRDRVLTDAELTTIWTATGSGSDFDRIVRLLMLTACRRTEIGGLRWSEITGDVFTLPAERGKNGTPHEVSLHPLAIAQLPPRTAARDAVFGLAEDGFSGWSRSKAALDRRTGGIAAWTLHDLRRTAATWLSEHDIEPHIVEAVLGHVSGAAKRGVAGIYNRASYRPQKRQALTLWAEHVAAITGQSTANVAALARAGG